MGGKAGVIDITHKLGKINIGEKIDGRDADDILMGGKKPSGGIGGAPGKYGMDQIKNKKSFFHKTKTFYTVVDRVDLMNKYPNLKDSTLQSENINSEDCNTGEKPSLIKRIKNRFIKMYKHVSWGLLAGGIVGNVPGMAVGACVGLLTYLLSNEKLSYKEVDNPSEYQDRDHNVNERRGARNEDEANLRNDYREPTEEKRNAVNIDMLHTKLHEKIESDKEQSGVTLHEENLNILIEEKEELMADVESLTEDLNNIQSTLENIDLDKQTKNSELTQLIEDIAALHNKETLLNATKMNKIKELMKAIAESQKIRDKKSLSNLELQQILNQLEKYKNLGEEFHKNKEALITIIDEYLKAIRARLQNHRNELKLLKKELANKDRDTNDLHKQLNTLKSKRLAQLTADIDIKEECEIEAEIQHEEEITNVIDEKIDIKTTINHVIKDKPSDCSYVAIDKFGKKWRDESNIEPFLKDSVRHYRSGFYNDHEIDNILVKITKESNENINQLVDDYKNDIKKVKIAKTLDKRSTIERIILLDYLNMLKTLLANDPLSSLGCKEIKGNVSLEILRMIGQENVADKIEKRFKKEHIFDNDKLIEDIEMLIYVIEDRKTFYLEKCAINEEIKEQLNIYEKMMLAYNEEPTLQNLTFLVRNFKEGIFHYKGKYFSVSREAFISTVAENIRHHSISVLHNITDDKIEKLYCIRNILSEIYKEATLNKHFQLIETIIDAVDLFNNIKKINSGAKMKKQTRKSIGKLQTITVKLIKYIDLNDTSAFGNRIKHIFDEYRIFYKNNSLLDMNLLDDICEEFDNAELAVPN